MKESIGMLSLGTLPFLLGVLVLLVICLMVYGVLRIREDIAKVTLVSVRSDMMMLGFVLLALLASGVFLTVLLVTFVESGP